MAEFKVEQKKQLSSEHGTVSQRKGETVLPDNRGEVSQTRVLTDNRTTRLAQNSSPKPNNTGLPNKLKAGIESLSGMSMDHVKVHYNSSQPAQLNAHAYAQGSSIHLAPGQEKHLPHEAWHVVQQAQGRVRPTMQMKAGIPVNNDVGLEHEADVMGAKASHDQIAGATALQTMESGAAVAQLERINPAVNNLVVTAGPVSVPSTDMVAPGPAQTWDYRARLPLVVLPAATKMAALEIIRGDYQAIGAAIPHRFLSVAWATNQANNNIPILNTMYNRYVAQGYVAGHVAMSIAADTVPNQILRKRAQIVPLLQNPNMLDELRDQATLPMVDPFKIRLETMHNHGQVAATVEFSEGQKGYVSRVEDSQSHTDSTIADRPNYAGEFPLPDAAALRGVNVGAAKSLLRFRGRQNGTAPTFSNVHHTATNTDVGTQLGNIGGATRVDKEAGIDAVTKIIAEGGRFAPAATLGGNLRNDSLFFTLNPANGQYRVMEFRELWKKWTRYFGGGYGVTNLVIRDALRQGAGPRAGIVQQGGIPAANGHNFNLDTNAVH